MCINTVYCPVCCQMTFSNIDTLRIRLIKAANGPLICPICKDILLGLDKLTIHLFSHTNIMTNIDALHSDCDKNKSNNDDHDMINAITYKENDQKKQNFIKITNNKTSDNNNSSSSNNNNNSNNINNVHNGHNADDDNNNHQIVINNSFKDQNLSSSSAATTLLASSSSLSPSLINLTAINVPETRQVTDNNHCKILNNQNQYHNHHQNQQLEQQIKCEICKLIINSNDLLKVHRKLIHKISDDIQINNNNNSNNNNDPNNCSIISNGDGNMRTICNNNNTSNNNNINTTTTTATTTITTTTHNNEKDNSRFQCHLCSKIFKMKGSLRIHLKVVHAINNDHLTLFNNIFDKLQKNDEMSSSMTTAQTEVNTANRSQEEYLIKPITISIPSNDNNNIMTDPNCPNDNSNHNIHSQFIENFIKTNSNKIIALTYLNQNNNSNNNNNNSNNNTNSNDSTSKIWECDVCSKSFTTKYFLKKHKRLHTGEMPYTCELCGKTFTFQQSYHKHLLYHSDEKPHSCTTCGRAFKELSTLHNHERIHSGEKPFKCENCGKCFRQRVSYLVHKRIHTGVMPYKCSVCDKSFRYKVSQRTHKCIGAIQQSAIDTGLISSSVTEQQINMNLSQTKITPVTATSTTTDLLQDLLQAASIIPSDNIKESDLIKNNHKNVIIENDNKCVLNELNDDADDHDDDNDLVKSIDDIVAEQCDKMGIKMNSDTEIEEHKDNKRISSPSEKLQNLCLYSPATNQSSSFMTIEMEPINEDPLKQFLFNVDENW